mgnify:FL=1
MFDGPDAVRKAIRVENENIFWKENLFWDFMSQSDLDDSECFEEFMDKVGESGLESVLWKDSIEFIATEAWNEHWAKSY